ncbi:MAG: 16S rRNA (guanine(966)-N(2))-methyltransferase RsmD [Candidatus Adiutrix sp.]|nr:16S rRNA (guanine(966)-N(2))-methyltransferase RsmD [Candidatus Adiutrix sp.]
MPRIIAGRFKGLRLESPTGRQTRPTADQVKEAVFSILESLPLDFDAVRVLDLFAGSGSLGLEALSRGAASAVFCDQDQKALATVSRNLARLSPPPEARLLQVRWPQGLSKLAGGAPFDLFFLDPPYAERDLPMSLMREFVRRDLAAPGAVAVWEQAPETLAAWRAPQLTPWTVLKSRTWGARAAAFFEWPGPD